MKNSIVRKTLTIGIKTITLVTCILLISTALSAAVTAQEAVNKLIALIDELMNDLTSPGIPGITWEDTQAVAEIQLQICDIVMQMLNKG